MGLSVAHAQAVNLITNPTFQGGTDTAPPAGYSQDIRCANGGDASGVSAKYTYGTEGGLPYIDIDVINKSSTCSASYTLFLSVANGQVSAQPGASYLLSANVKVLYADLVSSGTLGYHLASATRPYIDEAAAYLDSTASSSYVPVQYSYLAGYPAGSPADIPTILLPRLSRAGVPPNAHFQLRLQSPTLVATAAPTAIRVGGLINATPMVAKGTVFKVTVPLSPVPVPGNFTSMVSLVDANGRTFYVTDARPATFLGSTSWLPVTDGFQVKLPTDVPEGRYAIRYYLSTPPPEKITAGPGAKEIVAPNGAKSYEVGQLVVDNKAGMYVGQHFHSAPPADLSTIRVPYQFARSLNSILAHTNNWWKGENDYGQWTLFDQWARLAGTTPAKKLLITFFGSPTWLSSDPSRPNAYGEPGLTAAPKDLEKYKKMVTEVVTRYKDRIFAVECWNEPDGYFAGDPAKKGVLSLPTQLADICKAIHVATKAVDPSIAIICPQASTPEGMKEWLTATTSDNEPEPVTKYCDMVGSHTYFRHGSDAKGKGYGPCSLSDAVALIKRDLPAAGKSKAIAITETGFYDGDGAGYCQRWPDNRKFSDMTGTERGNVIYQTLATARELGVALYGLYSYDGGSEPGAGAPVGNEGTYSTNVADNTTVYNRLTQSVTDLGVAGVGLQPISVEVFQLPSKTTMSYKSDKTVSFSVTLANAGLQPVANVGFADAVSSTSWLGGKLVLDSTDSTACKTTVSQITCALGTLNPGESTVIKINAHVSLGGTYSVTHAASVQWDVPAKPTNTVKTATTTSVISVTP